tara:strand:- start:10932 stop:11168 length:237 start_codon:yes stop_codon:yes gene_type:complete
MSNKISCFSDIKDLSESEDRFVIGISVFNKQTGKVDTFAMSNKFPYQEINLARENITECLKDVYVKSYRKSKTQKKVK